MKAEVIRTDDVIQIRHADMFRPESTIKDWVAASVQPCCLQDRHRPLTGRPKGAKE